jgi:hypothetical protein
MTRIWSWVGDKKTIVPKVFDLSSRASPANIELSKEFPVSRVGIYL